MQLSLFQPDPPKEKASPPETKPVPVLKKKSPADPRTKMNDILGKHLPAAAVDDIIDWVVSRKVRLKITNARSSKLGDYRPAFNGSIPRISVNHDLNQYSFLVTLVHEMAHHMVYEEISRKRPILQIRRIKRPKPHGEEWQTHYRILMQPFLNPGILPADVIEAVQAYLEKPKASTTADHQLFLVLKRYDIPDGSVLVERLPFDALFRLPDGRTFRKKEKMRKRYRCISQDNGRIYLFSPMAQVYASQQ